MITMRVAAAVVCCLLVTSAAAQAPTAVDAFNQAENKFAAGDRAGACALYEQALANAAQLPWKSAFLASTKLALCKRDANKLASAATLYRRAAEILRTNSTSADNKQRQQAAQKAADELAALLSRLTIAVPPDAAKLDGFRVTLDGRELGVTEWNKPIEIDGGTYVVHASASKRVDFEQRVTVADQKDSKTVNVPALAPVEQGTAPPTGEPAPEPVDETVAPTRNRIPAFIAGGVGVVALGVALGFELSARSTYSDYEADPAHPTSTLDSANGKRDIANGFVIGAGVAFAAGAALWFLWPARTPEHTTVSIVPVVGPEVAGASARMSW